MTLVQIPQNPRHLESYIKCKAKRAKSIASNAVNASTAKYPTRSIKRIFKGTKNMYQ